jgi:hypothetical protein
MPVRLAGAGVDLRDGPHAARGYEFVARGIAEALMMVGAGSTYRDAALQARERAKRLPVGHDGEPRFSRHGSLVMDWWRCSRRSCSSPTARARGRTRDRFCWTTCVPRAQPADRKHPDRVSGVRRDGV